MHDADFTPSHLHTLLNSCCQTKGRRAGHRSTDTCGRAASFACLHCAWPMPLRVWAEAGGPCSFQLQFGGRQGRGGAFRGGHSCLLVDDALRLDCHQSRALRLESMIEISRVSGQKC